MNLTYPLADRHPLPAGLKDVPGSLSASPHRTHADATILAFAFSHGDRLQFRQLRAIWFGQGMQIRYEHGRHRDAAPVYQA